MVVGLFINMLYANYCSDFRYESNGIFVLGVGFFFLQTNFDFLTRHFWRNFFISFENYWCPEFEFEKIFHLWSFWGRSTVPKYNSAENEKVFNSAENWWFSALLSYKFIFGTLVLRHCWTPPLRVAQQCRSTTVLKTILLFNSAENHQISALLNTFSFSALLYFGTVVLPRSFFIKLRGFKDCHFGQFGTINAR